ncbi:MAG: nuclease-related domain-containing protein [Patulibacter sp.]
MPTVSMAHQDDVQNVRWRFKLDACLDDSMGMKATPDNADLQLSAAAGDKWMKLRYAGTCRCCGTSLPARAEAIYERSTKTVRCVACPDAPAGAPMHVAEAVAPVVSDGTAPPAAVGKAGASARREYERRKAKDEARVRARWGKLGGIAVAFSEERQSTKAWKTGAIGEERLGARLSELNEPGLAVLHDRRVPGTRANIDHIAITSSGIWVIDAKRYQGRPVVKAEGGLMKPRVEKLFVGKRDCTKLVDGMLWQVEQMREQSVDIPVSGVLCFIDSDWPLLPTPFVTRGVRVVWPKRLYKLLRQDDGGRLDVAAVRDLVAARFPQA